MKSNRTIIMAGALAMFALMFMGCTKPYHVISELEQPIRVPSRYCIGDIADLPLQDTDENDLQFDMIVMTLGHQIADQLDKAKIFESQSFSSNNCDYEVTGSLIEYKKGSNALQFFVGFGAGKAKLTANLKLIEQKSGEVVFSANFTRTIKDYRIDNESIFQNIAKDFAKALSKQLKNLR